MKSLALHRFGFAHGQGLRGINLRISHIRCVILGVLILVMSFWPSQVFARVTPEDIVNSKREAYESVVKNYSFDHKQKLKILSDKIVEINKKRTDELEQIMVSQAGILDEYVTRFGGKNSSGIEKARYQITFAHEAVAYQAAKIYTFTLNREGNIKSDALNLISLFAGELNSARSKVIYSGQILQGVIK